MTIRKVKDMKIKMRKSPLVITAVLLFTAGMAFAGFPGLHHSSQKSADIDLIETTKVPNGPTLQAGSYKVTLLSGSSAPELGFYQDGKLSVKHQSNWSTKKRRSAILKYFSTTTTITRK
jgi:hypothetical protein